MRFRNLPVPVLFPTPFLPGAAFPTPPPSHTASRPLSRAQHSSGFILDGGVHTAAMLRIILPVPPARIIATAALHRTHLLPHDTVTALALPPASAAVEPHGPSTKLDTAAHSMRDMPIKPGKSFPTGTLLLSWSAPDTNPDKRPANGLWAVCEHATISLSQAGRNWVLTVTGVNGRHMESSEETVEMCGVAVELEHFGAAVAKAKAGKKDDLENWAEPRGSLWDLALIEACLNSDAKEVDLASLTL